MYSADQNYNCLQEAGTDMHSYFPNFMLNISRISWQLILYIKIKSGPEQAYGLSLQDLIETNQGKLMPVTLKGVKDSLRAQAL